MKMENKRTYINWHGKCVAKAEDAESKSVKEAICDIDDSLRRIADALSGIESSMRYGNSEENYEKHGIPVSYC